MEGLIRYNAALKKFELVVDSKVIAKSKNSDYFEYHYARGDVPKLAAVKISKFVYEGATDKAAAATSTADDKPVFNIDERFEMMDELVGMTINGNSKAMLVAGKGGIGKTYTVMQKLKSMGKTDVNKAISEMKTADEVIEEDGEEAEAVSVMDAIGDYKVVRGYVTPPALYRLLYENANRIIIFDDCDSVLRDDNSLQLIKGAIDSYEERWVSWFTASTAVSDIPPTFKFNGQLIFITNLAMEKVDEAVRTRCFKVDVAMTPEQRIERMETVLENVMPGVDIELKKESIELMKEYLKFAKDISFRALMNVIKIRTDPTVKDWKKLAKFALIEN